MSSPAAIEVRGLVKHYRRFPVLHGIELRVPRGSVFGFLGPNGAGKTTTIRILLGLLRSDGGTALVLGQDCWQSGTGVRRQVGYLPGDVRFYDNLSGRATLQFFDRTRGCDSSAEIARLAELFDLNLDKRVRSYSRGMKQKLGLIQAMMHRPALLILDEPTTALDPLVRESLNDELRRVAGEGRTVLFSSHTLSEVEALCDEVAILRGGRVIEHEQVDVLLRRAVRHVEVLHREPLLPAPPGLRVLHASDGRLVGAWSGAVQPLLDWLHQCRPSDATISPPDLEDLFLTYYTDGAGSRDGAAAPDAAPLEPVG